MSDTATTEVFVECSLLGSDVEPAPLRFAVSAAMPNPFSNDTRIRLSLPEPRFVRVLVFDVAGRRVAELANGEMGAGRWDIAWNGRLQNGGLAGAGVYLMRIQAGKDAAVKRVIRVR
jgi:FlgD Ig-like domain